MQAPPAFTSHEDWFAWLAKHLAGRQWNGSALQFYLRQFFHGYAQARVRPELATFLANQVEGLSSKVALRLASYVDAHPPFLAGRRRAPLKTLQTALAARTKRPFSFERLRATDSRTLGKVTGVARDQLLLSIGLYLGRAVRSVDSLQRHIGNDVTLAVEHWRIHAAGKPAYELWTMSRLTGVVCTAGTVAPVLRLQAGRYEGGPRGLATKLAPASAFFALTNFAA